MADRRRRRRNSSNTESEYSEGEDTAEIKERKPIKKESECDSEVTQGEDDTSEYDSTTEGYDEDETEEDDEVTEEIDDDDDVIIEDGAEDDWIKEERQRGDGEEEPNDGKNLDDDEDKKNPAYIPRKGAFYEHDTRLGDEVKPEKEELVPKKKLWTDVGKWDHDRYNPDQQCPKSREEIIAIYGYDIRSREKPPESFPRGIKSQRRWPDRRKQLGDFISAGEEKSYNRPYRGRGGRGSPWRGSPRGRGWQPARRSGMQANNEHADHSYTEFKNARNEAVKYSADIYSTDSGPRSGTTPGQRQWSATNQKGSGNRMKVGDERPNSSEDSLSNPPDVVPAGHAYSTSRMDHTTEQQSRPRYKQGANWESAGHRYVEKSDHGRDSRSKGNQSHGKDSDLGRLSKNLQRVSLDDKTKPASAGLNASSQDGGALSIYPPVTSQLPASSAGDKMATTSVSQSGIESSSVIPPLTKPHKSTPTTQTKQTESKGKQADSTRTKRYSTQRQRPPQEMSGYVQESTRETSISQPSMPTQSAQIAHGQGPMCTPPMPQYYGQLYARPPAVFRQPNPVGSQSPPHTLSFPQPPVIQPPLQAVPFSIPASSHVQSPPRLHLGPESTVATASITGAVPPNGGQPILQGPFVPAPVMNYGPPGQQPPPPAPSHYQMAGHVPIQFPAPAQGPEPIQIHGGTTYFSHEAPAFRTGTTYFSPEAQQASPSRSTVTRRPKAAIPIINPQDVNSAGVEQDDTEDGEPYAEEAEFTQDNRDEAYSHEDECYADGKERSTESHEPCSDGFLLSTGCDLTAEEDSGYMNSHLVHDSEHVPNPEITASSGCDQVSEAISEQNVQDNLSGGALRQHEAVITESSPGNNEPVQLAAHSDNMGHGHMEQTICLEEGQTDSKEGDANIAVKNPSATTPDSSVSAAMDSKTNSECRERTSSDDSSKTDVNEQQQPQQQSKAEETPAEPHTSQGTETIMTEIKLVYTEAPET